MSLLPGLPTAAALVTGASAGIGAHIAGELIRRGHPVILVARREDRLRELAQSLGPAAHVLAADLTDPAARAALPARVADLGLQVEILVNNAGAANVGRVADVAVADELALIELDVAAVVDLCSRFVPGMVARGRGAVLNVASVGAFGPVPFQASYGAAKAFVLSYTEALREELRGSGVTASVVCPGPVRTGFGTRAGIPDEEAEKMLPAFLWQQPEAVARTAVDGWARGRAVIVPGAANAVAALAYRLVPRRVLLPILARSHPARHRHR
ncbi:oxidoreductase [Mycolicibacterium duvalii]|uniref:Short-chain dehydrogenase n=1 Tax=Mycolicibacterium duvalii TaxID=39688 RepID=A0A7I7JVK1_9MYCO|nr:SDR family oxidoreductase [Mycolicibacterium duvalii]MCV7368569.1 SDR family oxidoreductase [Mycolicibacterium duvalii]PEG39680.1 oxidoreductase [Mycolicibacterium duvalii]BBX15264.1 short-chain dehydrogenase [Mycolicibacterium duvalii]